jgi:hypothetical protein
MTEDQNLIKTICEASYKPIKEASIQGSELYRSYTIDCSVLELFTNKIICSDARYKPMFDELSSFKCPILYWFEIVSSTSTEAIIKSIVKYNRGMVLQKVPAMRSKLYHGTTILYVGKVVNNFHLRVLNHFGYSSRKTQGLQLHHWSKGMNLILQLHVYTFKTELAPLMTVIERGVADRLKPLLGQHK